MGEGRNLLSIDAFKYGIINSGRDSRRLYAIGVGVLCVAAVLVFLYAISLHFEGMAEQERQIELENAVIILNTQKGTYEDMICKDVLQRRNVSLTQYRYDYNMGMMHWVLNCFDENFFEATSVEYSAKFRVLDVNKFFWEQAHASGGGIEVNNNISIPQKKDVNGVEL